MRALLLALPLALMPLPAAAAPADRQIPPELSDPAIADKLTKALVPLSRALMNMPIGELEAALTAGPDAGEPFDAEEFARRTAARARVDPGRGRE